MSWWANRRNQLIAAQAVAVVGLCLAAYAAFLQPGSPGSLDTITAPGRSPGPHASAPGEAQSRRKKLVANRFETVWGVGYRFSA